MLELLEELLISLVCDAHMRVSQIVLVKAQVTEVKLFAMDRLPIVVLDCNVESAIELKLNNTVVYLDRGLGCLIKLRTDQLHVVFRPRQAIILRMTES